MFSFFPGALLHYKRTPPAGREFLPTIPAGAEGLARENLLLYEPMLESIANASVVLGTDFESQAILTSGQKSGVCSIAEMVRVHGIRGCRPKDDLHDKNEKGQDCVSWPSMIER